MTNPKPIEKSTFLRRSSEGLAWLKRSIDANKGQGSSAFYAFWRYPWRKGWAPPYPETTGYIIETLLDYDPVFHWAWLKKYAASCADWLTTTQLESGAFPSLFGKTAQPSLFNTGQILFGLSRMMEIKAETHYQKALESALKWMLDYSLPEGGWKVGHYVDGFLPTYYTRALWGMCVAGQHCRSLNWRPIVQKQLMFLLDRIDEDGNIKAVGFFPDEPAFTHTIAYALRGFLETAHSLENSKAIEKLQQPIERLFQSIQETGRLAGRYSKNWEGDFSFKCLTGHAQISLLFGRWAELTGEQAFADIAQQCFGVIEKKQRLNSHPGSRGGLPGSSPIYGPYLPFRYPNWSIKFYLDALLMLHKQAIPE